MNTSRSAGSDPAPFEVVSRAAPAPGEVRFVPARAANDDPPFPGRRWDALSRPARVAAGAGALAAGACLAVVTAGLLAGLAGMPLQMCMDASAARAYARAARARPARMPDRPRSSRKPTMTQPAFFHQDSGRVRFWVAVDGVDIGATVSKDTLHYRYTSQMTDEDPMATFRSHLSHLEDAVRRRVATGSIEPVMLRESDLPPEAGEPLRR